MNLNEFEIKIDDYIQCEKIEGHNSSNVYVVEKKDTQKKFAAKIINEKCTDEESQIRVNREIEILVFCDHPTIIKFYGFSKKGFNDKENAVVIMELAKNGSIATMIKKCKEGVADPEYDNTKKQIILIGIARGMMILNQKRIIHQDLKPDNILLDDNYYPKITDFNFLKTCKFDESQIQPNQYDTYKYIAPEVINNGFYDFKADVFSFGIIMYEVLNNEHPFLKYTHNPSLYMEKLSKNELEIELNSSTKEEFKKLIEQCIKYDPKERPSFAEIYQLLSNVDNENFCLESVNNKEIEDYIKLISDSNANDDIYSLKATINYLEDQNSILKEQFAEEKKLLNNRIAKLENLISKRESTENSNQIHTETGKNDSNSSPNENGKITDSEKEVNFTQKIEKLEEKIEEFQLKINELSEKVDNAILSKNENSEGNDTLSVGNASTDIKSTTRPADDREIDLNSKVDQLTEKIENLDHSISKIDQKVAKEMTSNRKNDGLQPESGLQEEEKDRSEKEQKNDDKSSSRSLTIQQAGSDAKASQHSPAADSAKSAQKGGNDHDSSLFSSAGEVSLSDDRTGNDRNHRSRAKKANLIGQQNENDSSSSFPSSPGNGRHQARNEADTLSPPRGACSPTSKATVSDGGLISQNNNSPESKATFDNGYGGLISPSQNNNSPEQKTTIDNGDGGLISPAMVNNSHESKTTICDGDGGLISPTTENNSPESKTEINNGEESLNSSSCSAAAQQNSRSILDSPPNNMSSIFYIHSPNRSLIIQASRNISKSQTTPPQNKSETAVISPVAYTKAHLKLAMNKPFKGQPFTGLFHELTKKAVNNIYLERAVEITGNKSKGKFSSLVDFGYEGHSYQSDNDENSFLCFDFIDKLIEVSAYSIKSSNNSRPSFLSSWVVEGSNDRMKWSELDSHSKDTSLWSKEKICTFAVQKNAEQSEHCFRFIRLRMTGKSMNNDFCLEIQNIEFFGKLFYYQ